MIYIIDKCILLLYCIICLLLTDIQPVLTISCLTAVTVSALNYALPELLPGPVLSVFYSVLTIFIPEFCFFLPLISYDYFANIASGMNMPAKRQLLPGLAAALLSAVGLIRAFEEPSVPLILTVGCLFSLLLRFRSDSYERLHRKYQKTKDDDTELQLLLEDKNQSLQEKQDNEIYTATLRERNRIAREIHDNVGHMLTRSILMVGALKAINREDKLTEPLNQLNNTLNQAMNSIRQSVHDLHDSSVNLQDSLQSLIRDFSYCPVSLQYEISPEISREIKYSVISIVKEALVNISRHSNATAAAITAIEHPGFYQFIIQDNGSGISCGQIPDSSGIGLTNIRSRVKSLNGNIQIQTKEGFRIYITIPKT